MIIEVLCTTAHIVNCGVEWLALSHWHWTCGLQLEDCALQLCRHTGTQHDYGMYLDLESTIDEQLEDLEGFSEKYASVYKLQLR